MRRLLKIFVILFIWGFFQFSCSKALAIDVVYPSKNNATIRTANVFIVGNIGRDIVLEINSKPVQTYKDGAFVFYTPLDYGANLFDMRSVDADGNETVLKYIINRPAPVKTVPATTSQPVQSKPNVVEIQEFSDYLVAKVSKDYMPLRTGASDGANRVTHPNKGTYLNLDAKKGKYYRVFVNDNTKFWIKDGLFDELYRQDSPVLANLSKIVYSEDRHYKYIYLKMDKSVPYKIDEVQEGLKFTLYSVAQMPEKVTKAVRIENFCQNVLIFVVPHSKNFGYKVDTNEEEMVLKISKIPCLCKNSPLKNVSIAIDAGHGGSEAGALGPTRVREADIALDISLRVEKLLRNEGAQVLMTRTLNENVGLYERIDKITEFEPNVSISIHANSLPDGVNPYERYGSSVYYYYPQAKELAKSINDRLVSSLQTRDDGVRFGNFVLTRMSAPVSVLVETAYMINPTDYEKLTNPKYRQICAQAIVDGLKDYFAKSSQEE